MEISTVMPDNLSTASIETSSADELIEAAIEKKIATAHQLFAQDPSAALEIAGEALRMAAEANLPGAHARALMERAMAHGTKGDIEAAGLDLIIALDEARAIQDRQIEVQCLHGLGNVHCYRGEYALALEYMHRYVVLCREIGDEGDLLIGLNNLGAFNGDLGNFAEAVTYFTDALQIARRQGNRMHESLALANIGFMKIQCGDPEAAREFLTDSIQLSHQSGERVYQSFALDLLAKAYHDLRRLEEAAAVGQQAVQVAVDIGNQHQEVVALPTLAMIQADLGQVDIAEQSLLRALEVSKMIGAGRTTAGSYRFLGKLYIRQGQFEKALHALEEGLVHAIQSDQKHYISDLHLAFSELYEAQGDYKRAFESLRSYNEANAVLQKETAQNRMIAQLARLEVERAQQEAEIHRLKTVELAEANRRNAHLLESLQQLAITDPLTRLYNRRYMQDYLLRELPNVQRRGSHLSAALMDLDNFKQVNDRFGHKIGDDVLKRTAALLQGAVRDTDVVVRAGGEEFVVILPDTSRIDAILVCERVRVAVKEFDWTCIHPDLRMTISIGVADTGEASAAIAATGAVSEATAIETREEYIDRLLSLADNRLYEAKALGKNRVV